MSAIRFWLLGIIATALLLSMAASLFPKGKFQTVGTFVGGLILLLVTVRPLLGQELPTFDDYRWQIDGQVETNAATLHDEMAAVISQKTAAYIQDKASSLGLVCHAEVRCVEREGVPFPHEVWLDVPYHEILAQCIASDLAISEDRQHWQKETP